MQGHIILVVEPGLVLQWSQWISPRHAEANDACLVRIILAGCEGRHSTILLCLCPACMVVSDDLHEYCGSSAYWNIFWYSSGRSSFSAFLFARAILRD
jgi:hypothetical protein